MGKPYNTSIAQLWDTSYYQKGRSYWKALQREYSSAVSHELLSERRSYGEALQQQYSSAVGHKLLSERKELLGSLTIPV
jgi:hypothetical protein